jgi:hypothetical protein
MGAPKGHPPYNKNGEGGRAPDWDAEALEQLGDMLIEWIEEDERNFLINDFCHVYRINETFFYELVKRSKRLADAYATFRNKQKSFLIKQGMFRKGAYQMASKVLAINHRYKEEKEEASPQELLGALTKVLKDSQPQLKDKTDG